MVGKIGLSSSINSSIVRKPLTASAAMLSSATVPSVFQENITHVTANHAGIEPHKLAIGALAAVGIGALAALVTKKFKAGKVLSDLKFKEQISKIFDESWQTLVKEVEDQVGHMKKPELDFNMPDTTKNITLARYNSSENKINVNLDFFKTYNNFVYSKSGGKIKLPEGGEICYSTAEIAQMRADGIIDDTFKVRKLSQAEMLLAIKSSIFHEQRHAAQLHAILNDSDLGPEKLMGILVKQIMKEKPHLSVDEAISEASKEAPYWVNYDKSHSHPGRNLKSKIPYIDTHLNMDARILAKNIEDYSGAVANDAYRLNFLELDANAWAYHCLNQIKKAPQGCRMELLEGLKIKRSIIEQQVREFLTRAVLL